MLVPAIASTGTWSSSSTSRTPTCAPPRAPPPPSAKPIRLRGADSSAELGLVATSASERAKRVRRIERRSIGGSSVVRGVPGGAVPGRRQPERPPRRDGHDRPVVIHVEGEEAGGDQRFHVEAVVGPSNDPVDAPLAAGRDLGDDQDSPGGSRRQEH